MGGKPYPKIFSKELRYLNDRNKEVLIAEKLQLIRLRIKMKEKQQCIAREIAMLEGYERTKIT